MDLILQYDDEEKTYRSPRRKDADMYVPNDGYTYVSPLPDVYVLGAPRQSRESAPAVVNKEWGLVRVYNGKTYDYVTLEDRWQDWLYQFWDWASANILERGRQVSTHINPMNPKVVYTDYTPSSKLELYAGMVKDAKYATDAKPIEWGARDIVTQRNMGGSNYSFLCCPMVGAALQARDNGSEWIFNAIDLLGPCPDPTTLPPHLYCWATQSEPDGRVTRFPDIKVAYSLLGLGPVGTPHPIFSLGGTMRIKKKYCKVLTPGAPYIPYQ